MDNAYVYNKKNDMLYSFVTYREDIEKYVVSSIMDSTFLDMFDDVPISFGYHEVSKDNILIEYGDMIAHIKKRIRELRKDTKTMKKYMENPKSEGELKAAYNGLNKEIIALERKILVDSLSNEEENKIQSELEELKDEREEMKLKLNYDTYCFIAKSRMSHNANEEIRLAKVMQFLDKVSKDANKTKETKEETLPLEEMKENGVGEDVSTLDKTKDTSKSVSGDILNCDKTYKEDPNKIVLTFVKYIGGDEIYYKRTNEFDDGDGLIECVVLEDWNCLQEKLCVAIAIPHIVYDEDYDYDDNLTINTSVEYNYRPITYCPFTGRAYVILCNGIIDMSEQFKYWDEVIEKFRNRKKFHKGEKEEYEKALKDREEFFQGIVPRV